MIPFDVTEFKRQYDVYNQAITILERDKDLQKSLGTANVLERELNKWGLVYDSDMSPQAIMARCDSVANQVKGYLDHLQFEPIVTFTAHEFGVHNSITHSAEGMNSKLLGFAMTHYVGDMLPGFVDENCEANSRSTVRLNENATNSITYLAGDSLRIEEPEIAYFVERLANAQEKFDGFRPQYVLQKREGILQQDL